MGVSGNSSSSHLPPVAPGKVVSLEHPNSELLGVQDMEDMGWPEDSRPPGCGVVSPGAMVFFLVGWFLERRNHGDLFKRESCCCFFLVEWKWIQYGDDMICNWCKMHLFLILIMMLVLPVFLHSCAFETQKSPSWQAAPGTPQGCLWSLLRRSKVTQICWTTRSFQVGRQQGLP